MHFVQCAVQYCAVLGEDRRIRIEVDNLAMCSLNCTLWIVQFNIVKIWGQSYVVQFDMCAVCSRFAVCVQSTLYIVQNGAVQYCAAFEEDRRPKLCCASWQVCNLPLASWLSSEELDFSTTFSRFSTFSRFLAFLTSYEQFLYLSNCYKPTHQNLYKIQ